MTPARVVERIARRRTIMRALKGRRPARRRYIPPQRQPDTVRIDYYRALRALIRDARTLVRAELYPQLPELLWRAQAAVADGADGTRLDAGPGGFIRSLVERVSNLWNRKHPTEELTEVATRYARATSEHNKEQLGRQMKAAVGVDVFAREPNLAPRLEAFAQENVSLIKSVASTYFAQVEREVLSALRTGERAEDLAKVLEERAGVGEAKAKLIARDQIGKLNGELNQVRQQALGIERFIWRSLNDERVRPEHRELDGKSFTWADGHPTEYIPGYPINCRCWSEPDVSDLLGALPEDV